MEYSQRLISLNKSVADTMSVVESQLKIHPDICGAKYKIVKDGSNIFAYWKGELVLHCSDFSFSGISNGTSYTCHWNHYVGKKLYMWLTGCMIYEEKEEVLYTKYDGLAQRRHNQGKVVQISPHYDLWMQGCKYGEVRKVKDGKAYVKMNNNKSYWFPVEDLDAI